MCEDYPADTVWAVWLHPIIRQTTDPVPQLKTGTYAECEEAYFAALDDPDIDSFYLELFPADTYPS